MTIARIGGEPALEQLARFKRVADREVRQEVALSWQYFDARSFAEEVLAGLPMDDLTLHLSGPEQIACLDALDRVPHLSLRGQMLTADLVDALSPLKVHSLSIAPSSAVSFRLPSLTPLRGLRQLSVESCDVIADLAALGESPAKELALHRLPGAVDLAFLARAANLRSLTLSSPHGIPLPEAPLSQVTSLNVDGVLTGGNVPDFAEAFPSLTSLTLRLTCQSYQAPVDLSPLRNVRGQVDVTLVDAGKVHGLNALPEDRVSVRHAGRAKPDGRARTGLLRRFRG
jgi:hypothetical protein